MCLIGSGSRRWRRCRPFLPSLIGWSRTATNVAHSVGRSSATGWPTIQAENASYDPRPRGSPHCTLACKTFKRSRARYSRVYGDGQTRAGPPGTPEPGRCGYRMDTRDPPALAALRRRAQAARPARRRAQLQHEAKEGEVGQDRRAPLGARPSSPDRAPRRMETLGWEQLIGRAAGADDLIVPSRLRRNRRVNHMPRSSTRTWSGSASDRGASTMLAAVHLVGARRRRPEGHPPLDHPRARGGHHRPLHDTPLAHALRGWRG